MQCLAEIRNRAALVFDRVTTSVRFDVDPAGTQFIARAACVQPFRIAQCRSRLAKMRSQCVYFAVNKRDQRAALNAIRINAAKLLDEMLDELVSTVAACRFICRCSLRMCSGELVGGRFVRRYCIVW